MIDPAAIKEKYAQMSDEALTHFAKTEGSKLTSTAFLLLKEEFQKRELDIEVIRDLEHNIILRQSLNERQFQSDFSDNLTMRVWEYAFEQKMKGVSSYKIYEGIMNMGIASEDAWFVINNLKRRALEVKKDASGDVSAGYGIIVLGIIVLYILYSMGRLQSIGVVIIVVGIVRLFTAMMRRERVTKVIENLTEKDEKDN
jgi:Flp pilus assembly protein TadB